MAPKTSDNLEIRTTFRRRGPEGSRGAIWEHFRNVLGVMLHGFGSHLGVDLGVMYYIFCRYLSLFIESGQYILYDLST